MRCPSCYSSDNCIAIEYDLLHPQHYDGVSEFLCNKCFKRFGRWSGKTLKDGEFEPVYGLINTDILNNNKAALKLHLKPRYVIYRNNELICINKKTIWNNISSAKNALIYLLKSYGYKNAKDIVKNWTDTKQIEIRKVCDNQ